MLGWCLNRQNWRDPVPGIASADPLVRDQGFMLRKAMSLLNLSTGLPKVPAALSARDRHGTCILINQSVPYPVPLMARIQGIEV